MIRTMGSPFGTVRLTVMGEGVFLVEPLARVSRAVGLAPRPLRCIDRLPIRTSDGLDDMMKKRGSGVVVV